MTQQRTADFFDSYAKDFNDIYGNKNNLLNKIINSAFRKSMKLRYIKTIEGCTPIEGKTVVDIGCGPGHYGIMLAKKGAKAVLGIDFAQSMIEIARQNAEQAQVAGVCKFGFGDVMTYPINEKYDYVIVMGFMDYVKEPKKLMKKVLSVTKSRAFFSFPVDGGFLSWQRKLRYKKRCELYMYNRNQVENMVSELPCRRYEVERIGRDFFVTIHME